MRVSGWMGERRDGVSRWIRMGRSGRGCGERIRELND